MNRAPRKHSILRRILVSAIAFLTASLISFGLFHHKLFLRPPITIYLAAAAIAAWQAGWLAGIVVGLGGVLTVLIQQNFPPELLAPAGIQTGVVVIISLLSASRERATKSLYRSETRQAAILDAALDCIITIDHEGHIVEWNPAATSTFGYPRDEAIGSEMAELIIPTQYREAHRAGLATYMTTGEGPVIGKRLELTALRRDGSEFPVELTITRVPLPGLPLFTGHLRDITARRQAEAALRESEAKFRQLAETIPQMAWMANPDGGLFWYNRRWYEYTGATPEQMDGWGWQRVHDPAELPRVLERWKHSIETGEQFNMEFPLKGADGKYRWFLTLVAPLRDSEGRIVVWFGTNTDIEDQRRVAEERARILQSERAARAEAERASQMKDEFLATLSHELRTPLNAILAWSQVLARSKDPEDLAEGLKTIERNARAQTQIIEDLLDMSRIIAGKIRLDVQRVDLAPVVEAAIETVQPAADAKGVRMQVTLDPMARSVAGDPARLQQIFWNLLSNAIKFTPRGGRVQVLLERVHSNLEISVTDTGEGISAEFLPHVFDRFRQADSSTTRRHGGLGLGLAIVKQLVELHGGTVRASSNGVGAGSTFTVALPISVLIAAADSDGKRRHPAAGASSTLEEACVQLDGVQVLVVDDEPDARSLVKRLLEDCNAVVSVAESAAEALEQFRASRPDVLLSDIGMPGEDGYALIRKVRSLSTEDGGTVPAIALTAYARSEDRTRSVLAGYQMHLAKPIEPAELIAMVASLAGKTRRV